MTIIMNNEHEQPIASGHDPLAGILGLLLKDLQHKSSIDLKQKDDIESLLKLGPWIKGLILGAFLFGGWTAALEIRQGTLRDFTVDLTASMLKLKERADGIDVWKATTDASRFTATDALRQIAPVTETVHLNATRITRNEEQVFALQKTCDRIETTLKAFVDEQRRKP